MPEGRRTVAEPISLDSSSEQICPHDGRTHDAAFPSAGCLTRRVTDACSGPLHSAVVTVAVHSYQTRPWAPMTSTASVMRNVSQSGVRSSLLTRSRSCTEVCVVAVGGQEVPADHEDGVADGN